MSKIRAVNPQIAPSILAADFARLGDEVEDVLASGADLIHFDVMDNHFVPNLTVGPTVLVALRKRFPDVAFDVHLMVDPVERLVDEFLDVGASMISVHPETCRDLGEVLERIRAGGAKVGVVLNPETSEAVLASCWDKLNYVLVMSVRPGFGGQSFMPEVLPKLSRIKDAIRRDKRDINIEIDGGISSATIGAAAKAGAEIFVAGSAIFNSDDYATTIAELRSLAA
ncbi:MAG: ribulose-phosphate 3-epimerase [Gammaproteobacteria bacterium]|nr:ribulose-phosphate 3-epimerase [Gammaproteobacteria bacterium]